MKAVKRPFPPPAVLQALSGNVLFSLSSDSSAYVGRADPSTLWLGQATHTLSASLSWRHLFREQPKVES